MLVTFWWQSWHPCNLPGTTTALIWVLFFYLFVYSLASFSVFGIMGLADLLDETEHEFGHYENLAKKHPWMGFALVSGIASLAGIPPLCGFHRQTFAHKRGLRGQVICFTCRNGHWGGYFHLLLFWMDSGGYFSSSAIFLR